MAILNLSRKLFTCKMYIRYQSKILNYISSKRLMGSLLIIFIMRQPHKSVTVCLFVQGVTTLGVFHDSRAVPGEVPIFRS